MRYRRRRRGYGPRRSRRRRRGRRRTVGRLRIGYRM